jgi:hypothetical protein
MTPKEKDTIFQQALLLVAQVNDKFFTLAKLLRLLHDEDYEWFVALANMPQLGRRKAYYLLQIEQVFGGLPILPSRLNKIGWTKLQVIAEHVTEANHEALLQLAEAYTAENLKDVIQGGKPIIGGRTVQLRFTKEQYQKFAEAILKHGAIENGKGFLGKERALIRALSHDQGDSQLDWSPEAFDP